MLINPVNHLITTAGYVFALLLCSAVCSGSSGKDSREESEYNNDSSGAGGLVAFVTGLPADRRVDELGESELEILCESINAWTMTQIGEEAMVRNACVIEAVVNTYSVDANGVFLLDAAACEAAVEGCETKDIEELLVPCETMALEFSFESCSVTVAEYEACMSAVWRFSAERVRASSCDLFAKELPTIDTLDQSQVGLKPYPECTPLVDRCPSF